MNQQSLYFMFCAWLCAVSAEDLTIDLGQLNARAFGAPSLRTGDLVAEWDLTSESNPEELGDYAEGDILFPASLTRNGLKAEATRWPNKQIPYEIKGHFDAFEMATIESALDDYHNMTCVRWVPRTARDVDYVSITGLSTGCWSSVGRIGGKQELNLQPPACLKRKGTVIHEMMHAVGFLHEQSREERDNHITVVWKNIQKSHEHNFDVAPKGSTNHFQVPYDYLSVMHYSAKAFSTNGKATLVPKGKGSPEIGQRIGFSRGDVKKINKMYKCTL